MNTMKIVLNYSSTNIFVYYELSCGKHAEYGT